MGELISVVVPVYNAERYLHPCIQSVLKQNVCDFELLLVNDGSKDRSLEICRDYAEKDKRIVVIDKPNGGVSSARNAGLAVAKGEWVTFVDADDFLGEHFFDEIEAATEDLLIRGEISLGSDGCVVNDCTIDHLNPQPALNEFVKSYVGTPLLRAPWSKFFCRSLIADLRFPEDMKVGEDSYFVQRYLARCNSYKLLCGSCYHVNTGEAFERKYACTVEYAAQSVSHLMMSYGEMERHLHIGWKGFWSFYGFFKLVSKKYWSPCPWKWYGNPIIADICKRLWSVLPVSQKCQYCLCHLLAKLKIF